MQLAFNKIQRNGLMRIRLFIILLFPVFVSAQILPAFYSRHDILLAPSSAFNDGLVGFANPANLGFLQHAESRFAWTTDGPNAGSLNNWGFFTGGPGLGFGMYRQNAGDNKITDYKISTAFGSDAFSTGLSYGWSGGDKAFFSREKTMSTGSIIRPNRYLSIGLLGNFSLQTDKKEGIGELAIRPLGSPTFTLFADGIIQNGDQLEDTNWSAGAALQVLEGLHVVARYFDSKAATIGFSLNFGRSGISSSSHMDSDNNHMYNSYMFRSGQLKPSLFNKMAPKKSAVLPITLTGKINYLSYSLFDDNSIKFSTLLKNIHAAAKDPQIGAIALNLSSTKVLPEHAWEIREALKGAKGAGIKIIAFIDNTSMTQYHLASIADKIIMDPEGILIMPGYVMSRTYMKGTLEKLGLGFDEWRFFKYKSALETFSRESYSDADREQRQDYIDSQYELVRKDVGESRNISDIEFDDAVDNNVLFTPDLALQAHLVDTLGRWSDMDEIIKTICGHAMKKASASSLYSNALVKDDWGPKPTIALVYALGECAMDTGIKGRWLEKQILSLEKNNNVKAIVFRADSPGGDAMASDLVAEALKKCKAKKPVIVTQGQVAGSGGYWISMYGDEIIAGPNTITGSIGVIGGWIWDKGFSDKLGMTSDKVQRGAHADIMSGVALPITGMQVPARNLTTEERDKMEFFIKKMYDGFVKKVAAGRNMSEEKIYEIAQGHFYSGIDGKEIGLVDKIGGLMTAIAVAKEKAGLLPDEEINLVEIPKSRGLLDLPIPMLSIKEKLSQDPVLRYIQLLTENPGRPLFMMTPDSYPQLKK
jgi:protease IV